MIPGSNPCGNLVAVMERSAYKSAYKKDTMHRLLWIAGALFCCLIFGAVLLIQTADAGPPPRQMRSPGDGKKWENLPPEQREQLKRRYDEWQALPPGEKERLRERMDQLKAMPPEARELYQRRFRQWQRLSPDEQNQLQRKLEQWDILPPEEKNSIRRRFRD